MVADNDFEEVFSFWPIADATADDDLGFRPQLLWQSLAVSHNNLAHRASPPNDLLTFPCSTALEPF